MRKKIRISIGILHICLKLQQFSDVLSYFWLQTSQNFQNIFTNLQNFLILNSKFTKKIAVI